MAIEDIFINNKTLLINTAYILLFISISILISILILFLFRFKENKLLFNYLDKESKLILTLKNERIKEKKYFEILNNFKNLLNVYTEDKYPKIFYRINYNLANAYSEISNVRSIELQRELFTYAITYSTNVLGDKTLINNPEKNSNIFKNIGNNFIKLSNIDKDSQNLLNAIDAYEKAYNYKFLEGNINSETGELKLNIGNCYRRLAQNNIKNRNYSIENYNKAIKNYDDGYEIFKILDNNKYGEKLANIQKNINSIKKLIINYC